MKLFRKKEKFERILDEKELEPYSCSYTQTFESDDININNNRESEINNNNINNNSLQSFKVMSGKEEISAINKNDSSYIINKSNGYEKGDISSIKGEQGSYENRTVITEPLSPTSPTSPKPIHHDKSFRDELIEKTNNYQVTIDNSNINFKTQTIYATPIFSGFLYKLGRNKRWQWRMFCFDGLSLACLSSKCKPKYIIPLDKVQSIKLLHKKAPEYKPNTFVITVEKNDCKGKMDKGFFPYSEPSISTDALRPKRTYSMGYFSYLLRAKTSVDLERWMFVLISMFSVMKREPTVNTSDVMASPSQMQSLLVNSNSNDGINIKSSFQVRNEISHNNRSRNISMNNNADSNDTIRGGSGSSSNIKLRSRSMGGNNRNRPNSATDRNRPEDIRHHSRSSSVNNSNVNEDINLSFESISKYKIPSTLIASGPSLPTMIISSQYPNRTDNSSSYGSSGNNNYSSRTSPPMSARAVNSRRNSSNKKMDEYPSYNKYSNSNSNINNTSSEDSTNASDTKRDIISAQRYRDPNYSPANYTSDLSNLRLESRRNKSGDKFRNPYIITKDPSNSGSSNGSITPLRTMNSPAPMKQPRKSSYKTTPVVGRKSPLQSPISSPILNGRKFNSPSLKYARPTNNRESVIVSSIMQDFIYKDFDKNVEVDESLKEYAFQSLRLFSLAEQKAVYENVQQAWNLGRDGDTSMLDLLVQELRKKPVKVEPRRESFVSQKVQIEIADDNTNSAEDQSQDNTFISFAMGIDPNDIDDDDDDDEDEEEDEDIRGNANNNGHFNPRSDSRSYTAEHTPKLSKRDSSMSKEDSLFVQNAWRNSVASLLSVDNDMNVSLGISNFCATLPRKSGILRQKQFERSTSLPNNKNNRGNRGSGASMNDSRGRTSPLNDSRKLARNENVVSRRKVNDTNVNMKTRINNKDMNKEQTVYLGDIPEEDSDSDSDSDDDDVPVRKESMETRKRVSNRMSTIPKSRPFNYYLRKNKNM